MSKSISLRAVAYEKHRQQNNNVSPVRRGRPL